MRSCEAGLASAFSAASALPLLHRSLLFLTAARGAGWCRDASQGAAAGEEGRELGRKPQGHRPPSARGFHPQSTGIRSTRSCWRAHTSPVLRSPRGANAREQDWRKGLLEPWCSVRLGRGSLGASRGSPWAPFLAPVPQADWGRPRLSQ